MMQRYALKALAILASALVAQHAAAQPCTGTAMGATTLTPNAGWMAATVPSNMVGQVNTTTTAGSSTVTVSSATNITVGSGVTGPNIPAGTTVTAVAGTTLTLSNTATGTGTNVLHTYTVAPWANNYPPTGIVAPGNTTSTTAACSVCPSVFRTNLCASNYVQMYMCVGNIYTISLCNASTFTLPTSLTVTEGTGFTTAFASGNSGCSTAGLTQIVFAPSTTQAYRIRLFVSGCVLNAAQCGLIEIACNPVPPPPINNNPATAVNLGSPAPTSCSFVSGTTAWATQAIAPPTNCTTSCGNAAGNFGSMDVWYSVGVPASGNLSVILQTVSAGATAFSLYYGPTPSAATEIASSCSCSNFVSLSGLTPSATVYIRVWPQNPAATTMGTFQICAYEPIPPPNDNPCGSTPLTVGATCTNTTFSTQNATNLAAIYTLSPATPSCGTPVAGGDVWFSAVMPGTGSMTFNTQAGTLTDMAMAVYTVSSGSITACASQAAATLTEVACNDNFGASLMPSVTVSGTPGVTYYVRMWNKTAAFGTASICAIVNTPPPNDNPCGAIALTTYTGCVFPAPYSTQFASITGTTAPSVISIPAPSCNAGPYNSDVWFTATVPPSGQLVLDTYGLSMTDGAYAVYTATGSCAGGNLSLTQVPAGQGGCVVGGSTNQSGGLMPTSTITGLAPGTTVYVRVWRQTANDGTFQICARNPVNPAGCYYTLRLNDSGGDGWNGGYVRLCIGAACTNYTVYGGLAYIVFPANLGDIVTLEYFPVGGFQNQISYSIQASNGFSIFQSANPPAAGVNFAFTVNAACNVPPAPISDCIGSFEVCNNQNITQQPGNFGNTQDLNTSNRGCLLSNERQGAWFRFTTNPSSPVGSTLAFTIAVTPGTDYDFGVWGPYAGTPPCPPATPPMRCNWSAVANNTGLSTTALNPTEGAGGPPFSSAIITSPNQTYLLYVDNFSMNGLAFTLSWNNSPSSLLDCQLLPVEWMEFEAMPQPRQVDLRWTTASESKSAYFIVERSLDGDRFESIGTVAAMGTTHSTTEYGFADKAPRVGMNYYRLQQVDDEGRMMTSKTVWAMYRYGSVPLSVYPNPAGESLWASFELPDEGTVRWRITDACGRMVREGRWTVAAGMNQMEVPLSIEPGSYLLDVLDTQGAPLGNARFVRR